jgi:hypothetical protein
MSLDLHGALMIRNHLDEALGNGRDDTRDGQFDVFLSHNDLDKPVVERIAEQLRRAGLRPFLDVWDLTPGGRWQHELADGLARSKAFALFVGPHSFSQWQLEELVLSLMRRNERDDSRVFSVLLPGVEDPFDPQRLPPFLSTRTWIDLRDGTGSRPALQQLLNAIAGLGQAQSSGGPRHPTALPWAGHVQDLQPSRREPVVFLCHSSNDKEYVRGLERRLRKDGIGTWLDERDLLPGREWDPAIREAIRAADVVVVCLSSGSVNKSGYLQKEIRHALDVADEQPEGAIFVIPAKIEPCDVPDRLKRWHWVDLRKRGGYKRLVAGVRAAAVPRA